MIRDTPYYAKVAMFLAKMQEGDSFNIKDKVKPENQEMFTMCFREFADIHKDGAWWWEWDDENNIIKKHANAWYKRIKHKL